MSKQSPFARRLVTAGAATAVVTGLLAGLPAGAHAAPAKAKRDADSVRYACTGVLGPVKLDVSVSVTNVPDGSPTELAMPDGLAVDVNVEFAANSLDGLFGGLGGLGGGLLGGGLGGLLGGGLDPTDDLTGQLSDLSVFFGDDELPVDEIVDTVDDPTGDPVLDTDTSTDPFDLPAPGDYDLALPEEFDFAPLSLFGIELFTMECHAVGSDTVVDEVEVDEQDAELVTVVDDGDVLAGVQRELGGKASGTVVATAKGKQVGKAKLIKGVARLHLGTLPKGTRQVKVRYLGNKTTKAATRTVRVR